MTTSAYADFPVWTLSGQRYEPAVSDKRTIPSDAHDGIEEDILSISMAGDELEVILFEDFENGLGDFTLAEPNDPLDPNNLWHLTDSCAAAEPNHSPVTALFFGSDPNCNYINPNSDDPNTSTEGSVTSPVISLADYLPPILLEFNYFLETENYPGVDLATVEVSQDGGLFYDYLSNDVNSLEDPSFGWTRVGLDLSPMAGREIQIRFRFRTIDGLFNDYPGFYVDDVLIKGAPMIPPQIVSTPITEAVVGKLYTYDVEATGNPDPVYSLVDEPNGMTINPASGLIRWIPSALQLGSNPVTVAAGNGRLPDAYQSFVIDVNEIPVYFADPNLQLAVEQQLQITNPLPSDMLNLTSLDAPNRGITDLTGIEFALNLSTLNLSQNRITDLFPLSGLENLISLGLSANQIEDIRSLTHFTVLADLNLVINPLNRSAYCVHLPAIMNANPGIDLNYDPSPYIARSGDCDGDCDVDLYDFSILGGQWLAIDCDICSGADFTGDQNVDFSDLEILAYNWLRVDNCQGDCDGDCDVDFYDYLILGHYWLQTECGNCGGGDLTGDNRVDIDDLAVLLSNWLSGIWI